MPRVPTLDYRAVDRALRSLGFVVTRQRGSHVFYRHETAEPQRFLIMAAEIWRGHLCGRFSER